eukprot:158877-Pyramimonas_sp.AAC.1
MRKRTEVVGGSLDTDSALGAFRTCALWLGPGRWADPKEGTASQGTSTTHRKTGSVQESG